MSTALCQYFQFLSSLTWARISEAHQLGLKWSEETATETLLLKLKSKFPGHVKLKAFERWEEASNGADWEWWFINDRGRGFPMRIQAKKFKLPQNTSGYLGYHTKSSSLSQIDTFISQSRTDRVTPLYCFYTHDYQLIPTGTCGADVSFGTEYPVRGCLVGHPQNLKVIGSRKYDDLKIVLVPWHTLICTCGTTPKPNDIAISAQHAVRTLIASTFENLPDDQRLEMPQVPGVRAIPAYVKALFDGPVNNSAALLNFEKGRAMEVGLDGIIAIKQT